jgi:uncharacterized protein (DUF433 family)
MADALAIEAVPLVTGTEGVILVAGTRVPLDTVVLAFQDGATAEEIAHQSPSISLGAAYQVIGYYLQHREDLAPYFEKRVKQQADVQKLNESRWPPDGLRARLVARRG